jgi:hypothetical protein
MGVPSSMRHPVASHAWTSYITDLHFPALIAPAGIMAAFKKLSNGEPRALEV